LPPVDVRFSPESYAARREVVARNGGRWQADATGAMMGMSSPEWSRYLHDQLGVPLKNHVALVVSTAVTPSPMLRQASSNWPSSAYALAKYDECNGNHNVVPVDRNAAMPEAILWTASEALPVSAKKTTLHRCAKRLPGHLFRPPKR
jgi:hypothetical protein